MNVLCDEVSKVPVKETLDTSRRDLEETSSRDVKVPGSPTDETINYRRTTRQSTELRLKYDDRARNQVDILTSVQPYLMTSFYLFFSVFSVFDDSY